MGGLKGLRKLSRLLFQNRMIHEQVRVVSCPVKSLASFMKQHGQALVSDDESGSSGPGSETDLVKMVIWGHT